MKKKPKNANTKKTAEGFQAIQVRHDFSNDEMRALTDKHLEALQKLDAIAATAKEVAADYKAQIKREEANSGELRCKLGNKYEMRSTECRVEYDAKRRMKKFFRVDNGKFVKEEAMSEHDYVQFFPFVEEVDKAAAAAKVVVMPDTDTGHAKDLVSMAGALTQAEKKAAKQAADAMKRKDLLEPPESEE